MMVNILLILLVLAIAYYSGVIRGAPFLPTQKHALEKMIAMANIQPGEKLVDLGSGDGRILIAAARAGAIAHGFEINPVLVWYSRYQIRQAGLSDKAFVYQKNFWRVNFAGYNIVTLFGITGIMKGLEKKLKIELAPGSRVISNIFVFPTWQGEKSAGVTVYRVEK